MGVVQYATSGAYAISRDALWADSDLRAPGYRPCHRRDGTAGPLELIYSCYHRRASPLSVTTTGRAEQPEDGPRRRCRRHPRDSHDSESDADWMKQLVDVGWSNPALSGLSDYATTGSASVTSPTHGTRSHFLCQLQGHVQAIVSFPSRKLFQVQGNNVIQKLCSTTGLEYWSY